MAERAANGGMTKREMVAMHTFMCKMSDMKPPDANEIGSANQAKEMQNDYTTGLAALTEWSRMRKVKQDNPWEKAKGYIACASLPGIHVDFTPFAYQTCMDVQVVLGVFNQFICFYLVLQMGANGASCQELHIAPENRFRTNLFWIRGNFIFFYHLLSTMCSHSSFVQVCNLLVLSQY
jgi:hypothetical protein